MKKLELTADQQMTYAGLMADAAEKALEEVEMDGDELERLLEKKKELQACFVSAIRELLVRNEYADEEVVSDFGYQSGYTPKPLAEQIATLKKLFTELKGANEELLAKIERGEVALSTGLPVGEAGAEGWFAIPRWQVMAKNYAAAVQKVLDVIGQASGSKFYNYRNGQIDERHLCQSGRTEKFFRELSDAQGAPDILIIAAQFGIRHRGRSVRRARVVMEKAKMEFGLGAFAVGCLLLTHPERLQDYRDLWGDCAGDEFAPRADGVWSCAPYFTFDDGTVFFDSRGINYAVEDFGSASGFAAQ